MGAFPRADEKHQTATRANEKSRCRGIRSHRGQGCRGGTVLIMDLFTGARSVWIRVLCILPLRFSLRVLRTRVICITCLLAVTCAAPCHVKAAFTALRSLSQAVKAMITLEVRL